MITRKIVMFHDLKELNNLNQGSCIINWFGDQAVQTPTTTDLRPLTEAEHLDACQRFKYWMMTKCKVTVMIHDLIQISNESFTGTWGYGSLHMASSPLPGTIINGVPMVQVENQLDYKCTPAMRGRSYSKGFDPQKYLRKHYTGAPGWIDSALAKKIGDERFYTTIRLDTVNIGDQAPIAKVKVEVTVKYMGYRVNGV